MPYAIIYKWYIKKISIKNIFILLCPREYEKSFTSLGTTLFSCPRGFKVQSSTSSQRTQNSHILYPLLCIQMWWVFNQLCRGSQIFCLLKDFVLNFLEKLLGWVLYYALRFRGPSLILAHIPCQEYLIVFRVNCMHRFYSICIELVTSCALSIYQKQNCPHWIIWYHINLGLGHILRLRPRPLVYFPPTAYASHLMPQAIHQSS